MECQHPKLKRLYYRRQNPNKNFQEWVIIKNFLVCEKCEMIFKILEEKNIKGVKDGRRG